jgi:hypothetical protein
MEPAPVISTCMRASLNWRVRCTHASLPPLALFLIPHAASRVSSQMITHRLRALKNPFSTKPFTRVNHHFLPTTSQSVFPVVDQRLPFTSVCILRGSCGGNRRTPLTGESERVLPQRGHSTDETELAVNRLRSMGSTVRENGHLGEVLVCTGSFACSSCWDGSRCSFSGTVCRSGSFPFTPGSSADV